MSTETTPTPSPAAAEPGEPLVRARGLVKKFPITRGIVFQRTIGNIHALQGVDFDVHAGRTLGIVGESGCGKSTAARVVARLLDPTEGSVEYQGTDITRLSRRAMAPIRRDVQMVFQDPYASLNPRQSVGQIISAPLRVHDVKGDRRARVQELMEQVGLNPEHYNRYPHEFSGGQRQRIGIARALALEPKLIICDEPVSALDVSIQAQVLNLLTELQRDRGLAFMFISHDLGVVRHISHRIAVMYLGNVVEHADRDALHTNPRHPYTVALISAAPTGERSNRADRLLLTGDVPSPADPPRGCPFHPRCPKARLVSGDPAEVPERCRTEKPVLTDEGTPGHEVACWYPIEEGDEARMREIQDAIPVVVDGGLEAAAETRDTSPDPTDQAESNTGL